MKLVLKMGLKHRVMVERPNVLLMGVHNFKALSCRGSAL